MALLALEGDCIVDHELNPERLLDEDEKGNKISRWQIGSSALTVLEQVYAMEPFPGLDTRRELSRKLNVSPRQVQVWFQNKRQRERKLSRAKGMLSTPGLPDTPAVTAAAAAAAAAATPPLGTGDAPEATCSDSQRNVVPSAPPSQPMECSSSNTALSGSKEELPALELEPMASSTAVPKAPDPPPLPKKIETPAPPAAPQKQNEFPRRPNGQPRIPGLSMARSSSLDSTAAEHACFNSRGPTSLDDMEIPLGLSQSRVGSESEFSLSKLPSRSSSDPSRATNSSGKRLAPPDKNGKSSFSRGRLPPSGILGLERPSFSNDLHMRPSMPSLPWMSSFHGRMPSEQAALHCRAAVAAAAAAMSSGVPVGTAAAAASSLISGMGSLPMLQSLLPKPGQPGGMPSLPPSRPASSSLIGNHFGRGPDLQSALGASLAATLNASSIDQEMSILDEIERMEDIPEDLHAKLLGAEDMPQVNSTPRTSEAISDGGGSRRGWTGGGGPSGGPEESRADWSQRGSSGVPMQKGTVQGLPMMRSGCSGLMDTLTLSMEDVTDGLLDTTSKADSDENSIGSTVEVEGEPSQHSQPTSASSTTLINQLANESTELMSSVEASDMQAAADRYVQVIIACQEPFQIVWASEAWLKLCGYSMAQVLGKTIDVINGPLTNPKAAIQLIDSIRTASPITLDIVNHTRSGSAFSHTIRIEPLRDSRGAVQCFQATSSNVEPLSSTRQAEAQGAEKTSPHCITCCDTSSSMPATAGPTEHSELTRNPSSLELSDMLDLFDLPNVEKQSTQVSQAPPTEPPANAVQRSSSTPGAAFQDEWPVEDFLTY